MSNNITNTNVTIGTSSTQVVASDAGRKALIISNVSDTAIDLAFGADAVTGEGTRIVAGGAVAFIADDSPTELLLKQEVNAICTSASKDLAITYVDLTV